MLVQNLRNPGQNILLERIPGRIYALAAMHIGTPSSGSEARRIARVTNR